MFLSCVRNTLASSWATLEYKQSVSRISLNILFSSFLLAFHSQNNPVYMNCQLPRKSDCLFLLLLNGCLAKMDGSEELALFSSFLENSDIKRSFRNRVGSGI
uniref:Neuropeptide S n=1 Tax=Pseudonaja textilis TaxID=8673 RepID=A0A670Z6E9_PSETE